MKHCTGGMAARTKGCLQECDFVPCYRTTPTPKGVWSWMKESRGKESGLSLILSETGGFCCHFSLCQAKLPYGLQGGLNE